MKIQKERPMKTSFKKLLCLGLLMQSQVSHGYTLVVLPAQVAPMDIQELLTKIKMIEQVKNQVDQIKQLGEQIDLAEYTNDILGEYGVGGLADIPKIKDSFEQLEKVQDLSSMLETIISDEGFDADEIFGNTFNGTFDKVEAPKNIEPGEYKGFATYESALEIAKVETETVRKENIALGKEASELREAAKDATDKATYNQLVDKAKAAEKAIVRNNQRAELAVANAELIAEAAGNHDKKREKALNDRAREKAREENEEASTQFQAEAAKLR